MSVNLRLVCDSDLPVADQVLRAAFERTTSFIAHMQLHRRVQPDLFFGADDSGQLIGTIAAVDYGAVGYIGLMAVDPGRQRQGIARQLVAHLLNELDARGCRRVLLDATDKGAPLYEGFNFVDDAQARVFELRTLVASGPPVEDLAISRHATLAELVAFDEAAFGASREKLLAALLDLHSPRLLVARDRADRLRGFIFARDPTLGPWLSDSPGVAESLLGAALRLEFQMTPHVMVPRSNEACAAILKQHGFQEQRSLRHMRRGPQATTGTPARLFGQSSFAHG